MTDKNKRGRPRCRSRLNSKFTFRLRASLLENLQHAARAERRNVPDFLRICIEDRIAAQARQQGDNQLGSPAAITSVGR
jgi:hypothetical protein